MRLCIKCATPTCMHQLRLSSFSDVTASFCDVQSYRVTTRSGSSTDCCAAFAAAQASGAGFTLCRHQRQRSTVTVQRLTAAPQRS